METTRSSWILRALRQVAERRADEAGEGADSGFTLIELMVVLLIMAILLAIAIPTFLGVKGGAQDRSAQSDLTNGITAVKAYYTNNGTYPAATALATAMNANEPELTWSSGATTASTQHQISVAVSGDGEIVILATWSQTGRCWYAEDYEEPATGNTGSTVAAAGQNTSQQGVTYGELKLGTGSGVTSCTASTLATGGNFTGWFSAYPAAA